MNLSNIVVVLIETSHPGNIGATARAMKNMGLTNLVLVKPKNYPCEKAVAMSAGAQDILSKAKVYQSFDSAIEDCNLIIATSARTRRLDIPMLEPKACAQKVYQNQHAKIALVFGREYAGLTNDELLKSHFHLTIAANPEYSSLNLAQAVQIVAYEIRQCFLNPGEQKNVSDIKLATAEDVRRFYLHLDEIMLETKFLNPAAPRHLKKRMQRIFSRVQLEQSEVNLLRGLLTQIQKRIAKNYD